MLSFASDTKNGPWLLWIRKMPLLSSAKTLSDLKYVAALHVKPCEIFGIFWLTLANFPVFLYLPVYMMAHCDYSALCVYLTWHFRSLSLADISVLPVTSVFCCWSDDVEWTLLSKHIYTVSQKKQDTKHLPITLPNIGRFSKFFHC